MSLNKPLLCDDLELKSYMYFFRTLEMESSPNERRTERRLRYHWPIWFAEDFGGTLMHGQLIDVSSSAAALTCKDDEKCPYSGQNLTVRFSIPVSIPKTASIWQTSREQGRFAA